MRNLNRLNPILQISNRLKEALKTAKQSGERRLQEEQKAVGSVMAAVIIM